MEVRLCMHITDDYHEKIHRWLAAPDPSVNQDEACKKRQETTGLWFIQSKVFESWKVKSGSMLWLHGIPGCGKILPFHPTCLRERKAGALVH